jgi:hypothetical protein
MFMRSATSLSDKRALAQAVRAGLVTSEPVAEAM